MKPRRAGCETKERGLAAEGPRETFVLYESREDDCWIAHGLRTDQIGTGQDAVHALADGIRAVDAVLEAAAERPDLKAYREAPPEIQKLARTAAVLPDEIYEIAHKMARGEWPKNLGAVAFKPARKRFRVEDFEAIRA
jgi:hypothetical protein